MCRMLSGTMRRFLRYPVSGRIALLYPAGYRIFLKFREIAYRVDSVKIKFTFSNYVKKFGASKDYIVFGYEYIVFGVVFGI